MCSSEEVPELYDRARPSYPEELFDDLVQLAGLRAGARVLEIGCGTGLATLPLAERGLQVVGVELGQRLAAVARRKLAPFASVEIVSADFETWEARGAQFDAVVSFTAFHWIHPAVRYTRSAGLLRDGGVLAVVETRHVLPDDGDPFFAEVQEDYDAVAPSDDNRPPAHPDAIGDLSAEIDASGCFDTEAVRRYLWEVVYDADAYVALLETFSGHRAFDAETRRTLIDRIHRRIEHRPERKVRNTRLATLNVARRR